MTAVRVEWAKALARCKRWREEVNLLREEMRHVLRSLIWSSEEWRHRAKQDEADVGEEIRRGWCAYAMKQAWHLTRIRHRFEYLWGIGTEAPAEDRHNSELAESSGDEDCEVHSTTGLETLDPFGVPDVSSDSSRSPSVVSDM